MTGAAADLDIRRKRLLWRARHRGMRELDFLLGGFAAARIAHLDADALAELEAVSAVPDTELWSWLLGQALVPPRHRSATLDALLAYRP